jgi:hypothetical protein
MKQEIMHFVEGFQRSTNKTTTKMEDVTTVCCNYYKDNHWVWVANKEDML